MTKTEITQLYERLSRDDELQSESNSISNQERYLENYAAQRGYTNIAHCTDDGWYGFTVSSMLTKPEYMGHTVNFRSSKKSYRDKRVKKRTVRLAYF